MKFQARISLIVAFLFFITGMMLFVGERADARAGGGHRFSGGSRSSHSSSRSYSSRSSSRNYSSRHSRPLTKEEIEAQEKFLKECKDWFCSRLFLLLSTCLLVFGSFAHFMHGLQDDDDILTTVVGLGFAGFLSSFPLMITIVLHSDACAIICIILSLIYLYKALRKQKNTKGSKKYLKKSGANAFGLQNVSDFSKIVENDATFNAELFINRVKNAFMLIQEGWAKNDLAKAEIFMADGTYEQFQIQINEMIANKIIDKMEDLVVKDAYITKIESNANYDSIYVVIKASGKNYRVNSETNQFIEGNQSSESFTEIWCFMRRKGTKTVNEKGLIEGFCPNCGTPIEGSRLSKCPSCSALLRSGEHDWVLTGITQASEWRENHNGMIPGLDVLITKDPDFNIQNIEDKLSVMFWRMCEANRTNSADPIRKIASCEFIEKYQSGKITAFTKHSGPAIGSVAIIGIIANDNGFDSLLAQVTWSGTNSQGNDSYHKSLFVLKRSIDCKTDSKKSFTSSHCHNCGAPVNISADNFCEYCNTVANDMTKDWILDDIFEYSSPETTSLMVKSNANFINKKSKSNIKQVYHDINYAELKSISDLDLLRITVAMMLADGVIDQRERAVITEICSNRTFIGKQEIKRVIATLQKESDPVAYVLNNTAIPSDTTLLKCLINIAAADGNISDPEIALLKKVAEKMQVPENVLRDMINGTYEANWNNKNN